MRTPYADACALCREHRPLSKSHIIPERCYKATFDEKHFARKLTDDPGREGKLRTGIYERLLCAECEKFLNEELETPFTRYWFDQAGVAYAIASNPPKLVGFDYTTFKLFHLSILWRASVARRAEFESVSLGPHNDVIRRMILNKDAGSPDDYPIFAIALINDDGTAQHAIVTKPQRSKLDWIHTYQFCYAGCEWYFLLTRNSEPILRSIRPALPQLDGSMPLVPRHWTESASIRTLVEQRQAFGSSKGTMTE